MAKIHWVSAANVSEAKRSDNSKVIEAFGLPKHRGSGRLAVVGGGPSINRHIEELRDWDGDIWAVNGTINWCLDNGIDAWFYTADASPLWNWVYDLHRITKAVLTPDCNPELIGYLRTKGAKVELTGLPQSGPTSVNASDFLSLECGYSGVTYFGAEGSFEDGESHAYPSYTIADWVEVVVGEKHYRTKAEFITQAIMLANVMREFPDVYSEKCGGLLSAMVEHGLEHDVYMVSNTLYAKLVDKLENLEMPPEYDD